MIRRLLPINRMKQTWDAWPLWQKIIATVGFVFFGIPVLITLLIFVFFVILVIYKVSTRPPPTQAQLQAQAQAEAQARAMADQKKAQAQAETDKIWMAREMCRLAQKAVREQLKAPSTAKFPDCIFSANQYEIRTNPEQTAYAVKGVVDAQNGFGAMLRYRFVVLFEKQPDGSFSSRAAVGQ